MTQLSRERSRVGPTLRRSWRQFPFEVPSEEALEVKSSRHFILLVIDYFKQVNVGTPPRPEGLLASSQVAWPHPESFRLAHVLWLVR